MPSTTKLREQRANIWSQMQEIMSRAEEDGGRDLTGEEITTYDRAEEELDRLEGVINRQERHDQRAEDYSTVDRSNVVPADDTSITGTEEGDRRYAEAFASWMRGGVPSLSHDEQQVLRTGYSEIKNAQGVGTGGAGGYTVPPAFRQKLVERITYMAVMRQLAEVINTDTGANLPWPTVDDTANEGVIIGENTQNVEQDVEFGTHDLGAYMYSSKIVRVSFQLLNDAGFDLEGWLSRALGARIGRVQNRHFTVGTGLNQPDGLITSANVGVTSAAAGAVTTDELVDLTESLDAAYLETGNAGFMMAQGTRKLLRKLKDGQGRPLWEPSLKEGTPDRLLGYGLKINNYMSAPAPGAKTVGFGDIREAYVIRDVNDLALLRLTERYADFFQVGFVAFQRSDGTLQNSAAYSVLQQAAA